MKVIHVIPSLDPSSGGPPMVATRLAAAQARCGWEAEVVAYRFPKAERDIQAELASIPGFEAVTCRYLCPLTRVERFSAARARREILPWIEQADMVHLHGVWDPLIFAAASVARRQGKIYALTVHGMLDPWSLGQKSWKKRIALALGYRSMLNRAAFMHFLNRDEQTLAQPLGLSSAAKVIPNGVFLEEIDPLPAKGRFLAAHRQPAGRRFVLFLSRLHYKKGLDFLADAFAIVAGQFPDVDLVVAGPDGGARQGFVEQVQRLGLQQRVRLVGPIYGPSKLEALVDCDCFCLPSRQEGFSMAVTEAMACGAPVVISHECHFPEVGQYGAGVVTALEAPAIAAGLKQVLQDRQQAQQMGRIGRELISKHFTWPIVARQMIEAYTRAMPTSGRQSAGGR